MFDPSLTDFLPWRQIAERLRSRNLRSIAGVEHCQVTVSTWPEAELTATNHPDLAIGIPPDIRRPHVR